MKKLNPKSKIGIKILEESQIKLALPDWGTLRRQISNVRIEANNAYQAKKKDRSINNRYLKNNLMYDNLFSIVGERGTGKTSVLFTLYNELMKEKSHNDILLPLIVPEMMNEGDTLIGLILSSLEHVVDDIEYSIKSASIEIDEQFNFFKNCVFNKNNTLRERYNQLISEYISIKNIFLNENYTYVERIRIEQKRIHNSYSFMENLSLFWDLLVDIKRDINKKHLCGKEHNGYYNDQYEPLLYLFIDDADLIPRILSELLYIMPKYMAHPNIVVIAALSPSIMRVSLEHSVYKDITGMPLDLFNYPDDQVNYKERTYDSDFDEYVEYTHYAYNEPNVAKSLFAYKNVSKLSNDILLKVFAPSRRFLVKEYVGLDQKAEFIFLSEYNGGRSISVKDLFEKKIRSISRIDEKGSNKLKSSLPLMAFSMLGNAAREICNVCYALEDMYQKLKQIKHDDPKRSMRLYEILYSFMSIVIDSNPKFKCLIKRKNQLLLRKYNEWHLFVNYEELNKIFSETDYIEFNKHQNVKSFISMYAMLWFIEYIVCLMSPERIKIHGATEFCDFLFNIVGCEHIVENSNDLYEIFRHIENLYENDIILSFNIDKITHQDAFLQSALLDCDENKDEKKLMHFIDDQIGEDDEWGCLYSRILYKRFSGVWLFDSFDADEFDIGGGHVLDEGILWAKNSMIESIAHIIRSNKDYISTMANNNKLPVRIEPNWSHYYSIIKNTIMRKQQNGSRIYTINEINKTINDVFDGYYWGRKDKRNRMVEAWLCSKIANDDVCQIYERLKRNISRFNSSKSYQQKLFIIKDESYKEIIDLLEYAKRLSVRLNIKANQLLVQCKMTKDKEDRIYVNMPLLDEFMDDMLFYANAARMYSKTTSSAEVNEILNKIYSIENMGALAIRIYGDDDKNIGNIIDYLMSLKAIVYIFESYIKAKLQKNSLSHEMHNKEWKKQPLAQAYRLLANGQVVINDKFEDVVSIEQSNVINNFIQSRWSV